MRGVMIAAAVSISLGQGASAQQGIRYEPSLDEGLFTVGLAHQIRRYCPQISARMFRAVSALRDLQRQANELGYDDGEIRRHLESDAEKERMLGRAKNFMAARGFEQTQEGYCALGREEIAQNSDIGALLRLQR